MKKTEMKYILFLLLFFSCTPEKNEVNNKTTTKKEIKKENKFLPGDLIFQTSTSSQSKAIQLATNSPYSHMGILLEKNGELKVLEAIQPVKYTPLNTWIKRGLKEKYVVKRIKDNLINTEDLNNLLIKEGDKYLGKNYDLYFEWSDDKIYCSELVWKMYKDIYNIEIGKLQTIKDFDLSSPSVKNKMKERYGNTIPLNEKVISPAAMFNSEKLIQIN